MKGLSDCCLFKLFYSKKQPSNIDSLSAENKKTLKYIVQRGDTTKSIALSMHISVEQLNECANSSNYRTVENIGYFQPGTTILIPFDRA
jgi:LysM repeat protein